MNKRGQFFLLAAALFLSVIIGLTSIVNSVSLGNENEYFYDLSKEIKYETNQVLDYGVFNSKDLDSIIKDFLIKYKDYVAQDQIVFIYGDAVSVDALYYASDSVGVVGINTGSITPTSITITDLVGREAEVSRDSLELDKVRVMINDFDYTFQLNNGQNFFVVMIKYEDGEKFVAQR